MPAKGEGKDIEKPNRSLEIFYIQIVLVYFGAEDCCYVFDICNGFVLDLRVDGNDEIWVGEGKGLLLRKFGLRADFIIRPGEALFPQLTDTHFIKSHINSYELFIFVKICKQAQHSNPSKIRIPSKAIYFRLHKAKGNENITLSSHANERKKKYKYVERNKHYKQCQS